MVRLSFSGQRLSFFEQPIWPGPAFCALMNTRPKLSSDLTMRGAELVDVGVKDAMLKLIRCRNSERAAAFVGVPAQHTNRANRHQCGPSVHRYRGGQQVRQSSLHALE